MIQIKKFIDRVSAMEGRQGKDVVMPLAEARILRDELAKLIIDRYEQKKDVSAEVIQVQVAGGTFR